MTCDRVRELASGFVLGALELDEMVAVQDHLDSCDQAHSEVQDLGGVLPYLAESLNPVEPPVWLRDSVMAAATAEFASRGVKRDAPALRFVAPRPLTFTEEQTNVVALAGRRASGRRRAAVWFGRAAAAALVVVVAGFAVVAQSGAGKPHATDDITYYLQPDSKPAALVAYDQSHAGGLAILMKSGTLKVQVNNLPQTQGDEVYTVWIATADGVTTKAGSFSVDDSGVGRLNIENPPTSASLSIYVCRDPNSKVTTPTGPKIVGGTISL